MGTQFQHGFLRPGLGELVRKAKPRSPHLSGIPAASIAPSMKCGMGWVPLVGSDASTNLQMVSFAQKFSDLKFYIETSHPFGAGESSWCFEFYFPKARSDTVLNARLWALTECQGSSNMLSEVTVKQDVGGMVSKMIQWDLDWDNERDWKITKFFIKISGGNSSNYYWVISSTPPLITGEFHRRARREHTASNAGHKLSSFFLVGIYLKAISLREPHFCNVEVSFSLGISPYIGFT